MRSFWKGLSIFLVGGVLGTGFGLAVGIFIFPYLFPPPPAAESLTEADRSRLVAAGTFIHANPSDPIHWGQGKVSLYERTVFLERDFKVGPGPKYHVVTRVDGKLSREPVGNNRQVAERALRKVQVEIDSLKKLMESDDVEAIKKGLESLTQASHKLAEMMYAQATKDKAAEGAGGPGQTGASGAKKDDDDVVDADFEEVK